MWDTVMALVFLLLFPGVIFLFTWGMLLEYADRKLYAWLQDRVGPPWYQPEADFVKLMAKEDITPKTADGAMVYMMPLVMFAAVTTAIIYIPVWSWQAVYSFEGDLILVAYLLTIPTIALFLIGWHSANLFTTVGAQRAMTQLFAYEVPLLLAVASPAILAGTWNISEIMRFQMENPMAGFVTILGFAISLVALQGKLERTPFDIPDAETEIVGGPLTEISGKKLAMVRLSMDILMVVGAALLAAIFLGGWNFPLLDYDNWFGWGAGFVLFLIKTFLIVFMLAAVRALFARLRIDQMVDFSWTWLAPLALVQVFIVIMVKLGGWF